MITSLIKKLRTCSAKERKVISMELARIGTDEAVEELINMARGGIRSYTQRTWRTLWFRSEIRYNLDDQLIGIEALSETGSNRALNYLKRLINPTLYMNIADGVAGYDSYYYKNVYYFHAEGELGDRLGPVEGDPSAPDSVSPPLGYVDAETRLSEFKDQDEYYKLIASAVEHLDTIIRRRYMETVGKTPGKS